MQWSDTKAILASMAPESFKGFINTTSGSIPEAVMYARFCHNEIAGYSHKFGWLLREYQLTLTGADSYDLRALIPDLVRVYQVVSVPLAPGRAVPYQSLYQYNIDPSGAIRLTLMGDILKITGAPSGTLTIPYYSNYLVKAQDGTRKRDFTVDTDESVIPGTYDQLLVEGIMRYVNRKGKKGHYTVPVLLYDGRVVNIDPFLSGLQNMALADVPIQRGLYDFRFSAT